MGDENKHCYEHKHSMEQHYVIICNLTDELTKLVSNYRILVGAANDLNGIALARKNEVKKALHLADELSDVISKIIKTLEHSNLIYLDYCNILSKGMSAEKIVVEQSLIEIANNNSNRNCQK